MQDSKSFVVISIFPEMFSALTEQGMTKQGLKSGHFKLHLLNLRDFTTDKHRTVDERPFGGGPGMLMKIEPLEKAVKAAQQLLAAEGKTAKVIFMSPQGSTFSHQASVDFAQDLNQGLIFICGRYEGVDQRFIDLYVDEEWSIGDFVLTGGELGAMVMIDAIIRHLPGVLNHELSAVEDSFANGLLDCPHYTKPETYYGLSVPEVLLSGHHANIAAWREEQSLQRTLERRPELIAKLEQEQVLTKSQQRTLAKLRGLPDPFPKRVRRKKSATETINSPETTTSGETTS